jgi:sulfoxide reductase heme-binding subunit YedZ
MAWHRITWHRTAWWRSDWQWHLLNLAALGILAYLLLQGTRGWESYEESFDTTLESGKWGVRWLLICLSMTPLQSYLHWKGAVKYRKAAGLWAFAFGAVHLLLYADETWEAVPSRLPLYWLEWPIPSYIALGIVSFTLLAALAITSNKWSMRRLGKQWKRLHRVVYGAGVLVIVHALLASTMSKKMMLRDPQAVPELQLYLGILLLLLTLRIPQVRARLLKRTARGVQRSQAIPPVLPLPPDLPKPHLPTWVVEHKSAAQPSIHHASEIRHASETAIKEKAGTVEDVQERERVPVP